MNLTPPNDPYERFAWFSKAMVGPQRRFTLSRKEIIAFITANGVGKTETLIWNAIALGLGWHPLQLKHKIFQPPLRIRLNADTLKEGVKERLLPRIRNYLPKEFILQDYDDTSRTIKLKPGVCWDGQPILRDEKGQKIGGFFQFLTYEQAVKVHAGAELDVVLDDEESPYDIWVEDLARTRKAKDGGRFMIGMTPEIESERPMTWSFELLYETDNPNVECIPMAMEEAPWISPEFIQKLKDTLPPEEYAVKCKGLFAQLMGLVYQKFSSNLFPNGNKIEIMWPDPDMKVVFAADVDEGKPFAGVWAAVDKDRDIRFFNIISRDEAKGKVVREICDLIHQKEAGLNVAYRLLGQGSVRGTDQRSGYNLMNDFSKHGINFVIWPEKPAYDRINATRQYIRGSYGPRLYITENCYDLLYDMTHLTYRKMGSRAIEQKIVVRDKGKCLPDCLSFICHKEGMVLGLDKKEEEDRIWIPPRPHSRVYRKYPGYSRDGDILELERIRLQLKQ